MGKFASRIQLSLKLVTADNPTPRKHARTLIVADEGGATAVGSAQPKVEMKESLGIVPESEAS